MYRASSVVLYEQYLWKSSLQYCMYICICVCCYSSRLVVYVPSISGSTHRKIYGRVYVFPFRDYVFLSCDQGLEFYISLGEIQSINTGRYIERRHVNREEFRE